jgi:hypothetical protein
MNMKKQTKILIVLCCFGVVQFACGNLVPAISNNQPEAVKQAEVWIDQPLDGATVSPPQVSVQAHATVESGFGQFQFEVVGEPAIVVFNQSGVESDGVMSHTWSPTSYGWQTLRVTVLNLSGDPVASAEIDVFVEEPEQQEVIEEEVEELPEEPAPDPTATPTPEPINRCELFDPTTTTLTLHDVPLFTTDLTYFLEFDHPVFGLEEPVAGDDGEWIYTSLLGETPSDPGTYRDYPGRIYFMVKEFPATWWGTSQPLKVYVNGCGEAIFTHDRVSILKPACETSMEKEACKWTGGKYECTTVNCKCACP